MANATYGQRLARRLQASWLHRDWLSWLLIDVSYVFRALVALRRWLYAQDLLVGGHPGVPVIVVGNVVAGGGGKTPVVIEIVRHLRQSGWQVGVVSRGYGRLGTDTLEVTAQTPVAQSGDEPALIHHALQAPVFVAKKRLDAARALLATHPHIDIIVCDDGLQHLALERDIEVCVFDDRGVGNGSMLPAGPLREPWPRTVSAQITSLVLHTGKLDTGFRLQRRLADYALRQDGSRVPLANLVGHHASALAGIAVPEAFFAMLRSAGITITETIGLPDHYDFNSCPRIIHKEETLICTEKDARKLWPSHPQALAVPLELNIEPDFFTALDTAVRAALSLRAEATSIPPP